MNQQPDHTFTRSFIGKQAEDLGNLISEQIKPIYESLGIVVPVKSVSIIHALRQSEQASLTELAKLLQQSHQLVKQKLPRLTQLGLITRQQDPHDKRRFWYRLTALGQDQAQMLNDHSLTQVYAELSAEIQADLYAVLTAAIAGLKKQDLYSRFQSKLGRTTGAVKQLQRNPSS
ncbi:MarR family winged helix-turn-helix transcriptional regulator [Marinicella meishanensis]|uniref:MarR family winged helix-turn-helix transcriptional regulator n=1 Tax=Marinicella meishanensis TaxID=2873263 RepID=UPI001CBC092D|nr:MarR family transcriptional regulator [Marinicella sp. NBU2979]